MPRRPKQTPHNVLAFQLMAVGLTPKREHRFDLCRRFRFDFAFVEDKVAVEVEGGIFVGGAHVQGARYRRDCEKYNLAVEQGWRVLRYTDREIKNGLAVQQIERVLGQT